MKVFNYKKLKTVLLTCLAVLSVAFGTLLYTAIVKPVKAQADAIASTVYQTDGASVRVFEKQLDGSLKDTDRQGIRFHVETGANYEIADGTALLDTTQKNANGSYKLAEGYKSYTLILPTRLMGGSSDLTMDLVNVMKIDTTEYWFSDNDGNWESVAYIYNIPQKWFTDEFTYRGVICSVADDGTETPVKWTPMAARSLAWVAKQAYNDTIDENTNYWGTAEKDEDAAPKIKAFIPTYNVKYSDGNTEEVLWGDKLTKADTEKTYYDENNHEPIDVTLPLEMKESCDVYLESTKESKFVLTGVEYVSTGFKVFATLPTEAFAHDVTLEPSTIDMVTGAGNKVTANSVKVHVAGSGADAISQLVIGFSYEDISNGTTLTILKSSHFYNEGVLYELEKDYEFVYNNSTWELPLGYITLGDLDSIVNYTESGANGVEHNIRINFRKDVLVNGNVTFDSGAVQITRKTGGTVETISDGYYYWNQGENMILEIPGASGDIWGEEDGDVLTIAAGTRLVQNNGFYIFQDEITATFNGGVDWIFSYETHTIDASAFTAAYTRQNGDAIYIDVHTAEVWVDHHVKVVCNNGVLTYHNTDNVTTVDPNEIFYHGENGNQILRIYLDAYSVTGDWVTIPEGTEFWVGDQIYTLTEDVTSYFVATGNNGMTWVTNPVIKDIGLANIQSMGWYYGNVRYITDTPWSSAANNRVVVDDTYIEEDGVVVTGSNYTGFYYYGDTNRELELQGTNFSSEGGSVTLKAGVILWLFDNAGAAYSGAYRLTDELTIEIGGAAGSPMYKDVVVAEINEGDVATLQNDGSHGGEIRFVMNSLKVTGMYGTAEVEGSATLNGNATTSAFVYGGDGTSGYSGNTIIAFTGTDFGKAFQATAVGDRVSIAAGTKIWLSNGSGYVIFNNALNYVWNGSAYVKAGEHTVTFSSADATIKVNEVATTTATAKTGEAITFTVEMPTGYEIASITNATLVSGQTYTTGRLWSDVTVTVNCTEPIIISQTDVTYFAKEGDGELRIGLNKERPEINAITGGNYNIAFSGTTELTIGGVSVQPTQYNYYGLIDGTSHQLLGLYCDVANMTAGDSLTIKAGSTFKFGNTVLLLSGDISTKLVGITANFNSTLASLSVDGTKLNDGETISKFVGGSSLITFGYIEESNAAVYDLSVKVNGVEQGTSGTYTVSLDGNVTIDVTLTLKTYTATVSTSSGASVSGGLSVGNNTITHGQTYNFTVSADNGYQLTSVTINGTEQGTSGSYSFTASGATSIVVTAKKTYTVTATTSGGVTVSNSPQTVVEGGSATFNLTVPTNATIKANGTQIDGNSYTVSNVTANTTVTFTTWYAVTVTSLTEGSVKVNGTDRSVNWSELVESGKTITVQATYNQEDDRKCTAGSESWSDTNSHTVTVSGKTDITVYSKKSCLVEGTMIMMADGTQKAVENIVAGDMVMVFNHETGKYQASAIWFNDHADEPACVRDVINLEFANGAKARIAYEHAYFDLDLMRYVFIREDNMHEFIGHRFVTATYNGMEMVQGETTLVKAYITEEVVKVYGPITEYHFNLISDDMLSMPSFNFNAVGMINIFDYDEDLSYNEEKMQADIEQYGLFTYEEFSEYMSYEDYCKAPIQYFKVAIGKGNLTWEQIELTLQYLAVNEFAG